MCLERGEELDFFYDSGNTRHTCQTIGDYCREDCHYTFRKILDKQALNTSNQDTISKSIMDCITDCKSEYKTNP